MTNDKRIEAWQAEFESLYIDHGMTAAIFHKKTSGLGYLDFHTDCLWTGFLMSRRSMQPIELPKEDFLVVQGGQVDAIYFCNQIKEAITASGYSYRVKE